MLESTKIWREIRSTTWSGTYHRSTGNSLLKVQSRPRHRRRSREKRTYQLWQSLCEPLSLSVRPELRLRHLPGMLTTLALSATRQLQKAKMKAHTQTTSSSQKRIYLKVHAGAAMIRTNRRRSTWLSLTPTWPSLSSPLSRTFTRSEVRRHKAWTTTTRPCKVA